MRGRRRTATLLAGGLAALAVAAPVSFGGAANKGPATSANPLAGLRWGTYRIDSTDPGIDPPSAYYNTARSPADRKDFDRLLAQPRFRWFGAWIRTRDEGKKGGARATAENYIAQVTGGDRDVAVGIGIFRLQPFEHEACTRLPTAAEIADYKAWID